MLLHLNIQIAVLRYFMGKKLELTLFLWEFSRKILVTDKGNGGQLACPEEWKKFKKNMNSSNSVMYISVCPVSYIAVVMFTCTLVRSHPDSRRRWGET
jgi:hypothetical protein